MRQLPGSGINNEYGVMLGNEGPQNWEFAYGFVCIHCLLRYTDLSGWNYVGDTKHHCWVDIVLLQSYRRETVHLLDLTWVIKPVKTFKPLFKRSFHSFPIDWGDNSGENTNFCIFLLISFNLPWQEKLPIFFLNTRSAISCFLQHK